jgi:hypothetical protein
VAIARPPVRYVPSRVRYNSRESGELANGRLQEPEVQERHRRREGSVDANDAVENVCSAVTNNSSSFYSKFSSNVCSADVDARRLATTATALLGSSSTLDVLGLIHERTGHLNKKAIIECIKLKLVRGIQVEDKHIRKYKKEDKHVCDVCARSQLTRMTFAKVHAIRGKKLGDYISVNLAVFVNCESREGYKYVACFTDHATKYSWVYPLKTRDEYLEKLCYFIDVELKRHGAKIKHYHADGGAELISKAVLTLLKCEGSRYTWNPADTPELNATSERKFKTLGERDV